MSGKILRAHIECFGGARNVKIDWDRYQILAIIGDGKLCKTSIVNFFKTALTGTFPDDAINYDTGQAKGSLVFEKDGTTYEVRISKSGRSEVIKVFTNGGAYDGKTYLRNLVGNIDVNPFILKKMKESDLIIEFKRLLKIDTRETDKKREVFYKQRTNVNAQIEYLDDVIKSAGDITEQDLITYAEPVDLDALYKENRAAMQRNEEIRKNKNLIARGEEAITDNENNLIHLRRQIEELQRQAERLEGKQQALISDVEILRKHDQPLVDITEIEARLGQAIDHNRRQAVVKHLHEQKAKQAELLMNKVDLEQEMYSLDQQKKKYIQDRLKTIPGLEIREETEEKPGGVFFNNRRVKGLANTEMVELLINIRKSLDENELPVIFLDDFEGVGDDGRDELIRLCKDQNYSALLAVMDKKQKELKVVLSNELDYEQESPNQKTYYINARGVPAAKS